MSKRMLYLSLAAVMLLVVVGSGTSWAVRAYGQLTHNGTHPAGAQIDFRQMGQLKGSTTTDANGNYTITLDSGNYTARVGADLCTPNPITVPATDLHQDLLQQ